MYYLKFIFFLNIVPSQKVSLCEEINIGIIQITNDGYRGLDNFVWELYSSNATT